MLRRVTFCPVAACQSLLKRRGLSAGRGARKILAQRAKSVRGKSARGKRFMSESTASSENPLVGVVMGSQSDWDTMHGAVEILQSMGVPHEARVVSAHRTPEAMVEYAQQAESRGLEVIIAGAGGAAHLPGMIASLTVLPVLGVPVQSKALSGIDSLLSIAQMPGGVPVGTLAIGAAGAKNAGLLAVRILSSSRAELRETLHAYRDSEAQRVAEQKLS